MYFEYFNYYHDVLKIIDKVEVDVQYFLNYIRSQFPFKKFNIHM